MITLGSPKGTLEGKFEVFMAEAGLQIAWNGYEGKVNSEKISNVIKLRPKDMALSVALNELDLGVTGQDCIAEQELEGRVIEICSLPLCRSGKQVVDLVLFARQSTEIKSLIDLLQYKKGKLKIATEYPNIARQFFASRNIEVEIRISSGATESLVRAGFVDAGIDVVDTGLSLQQNQLQALEVIMQSKTVLISNTSAMADEIKRQNILEISQLLLQATQNQQTTGPDFIKRDGLIFCIVQDWQSSEVLMHCYMDVSAWEKTKETGYLWRYSTSQGKLQKKGETSGNIMKVHEISLDCDRDACSIKVEVLGRGEACHTGNKSCFFNKVFFNKVI